MNWHLHVTVEPHWSWTHVDLARALQQEIERHGIRPTVITNHLRGGGRYRELIPTRHWEGDEASASREIFKMGVLLNNTGWRVRRLKVEGDPREPSVERRAIYFETHLKNAALPEGAAPRSTSAGGSTYHTLRRPTLHELHHELALLRSAYHCDTPEVEAAVVDTAPELDLAWLASYEGAP